MSIPCSLSKVPLSRGLLYVCISSTRAEFNSTQLIFEQVFQKGIPAERGNWQGMCVCASIVTSTTDVFCTCLFVCWLLFMYFLLLHAFVHVILDVCTYVSARDVLSVY